ncbi:MAG TPA: hypothetical protein VEW28_05790 [Candidatus Kapabacteria bacterium]|nr:hypothetical protein [Candidatus Kapabacteria bacterium]
MFSPVERRALRILLIVTLISRLALALRPEWQIVTRPYSEDSFYIFTVAGHIAHGDGITADGVHTTNGIQPLIAFVYVPFFLIAGANKLLALRLCFIVVALCDTLSVLFLAKLLKQLARSKTDDEKIVWFHPPIAAAALWALLYPIITHTANGLETGLYSMLIIASMYVYATLRNANNKNLLHWAGFGALLGLTVLARIDAVFLVIVFALIEIIRSKGKEVVRASILSLTALIVSSPWWIYNYIIFHGLMPQSGTSESLASVLVENLARGSIVIGDILSVFFILPNYELPVWFHFAWMALLVAIVVIVAKKIGATTYLRTGFDVLALSPLLLFSTVLIIFYVFFFSAPHFLPRYFQPPRILWIVIFSAALPLLVSRFRQWQGKRRRLLRALLWVGAVCVIGFGLDRYIYYFTISTPSEFYTFAKWANERPHDRIGMDQSGTAGFFAPNVVNLDGKVNVDALNAKKAGDIGAYVVTRNLDYIADWREFSSVIAASASRHGAKFEIVDSVGRVIIYKKTQ